MNNECGLTTLDNPFDPFSQFNDWFLFDIEKGYYTCSYLARLTNVTEDLSLPEENKEIERAIDEIIEYDVAGIYKKVYRQPLSA